MNQIKQRLLGANERKELVARLFASVICRQPNVAEVKLFTSKDISVSRLSESLNGSRERCVPKAVVGSDIQVNAEVKEVALTGILSVDPKGEALTWKWTIVQGASAELVDAEKPLAKLALPADSRFNDYYAASGDYKVALTVTNSGGKSSTPAVVTVTVSQYTGWEKQLLVMVNNLRAKEGDGASQLVLEPRLTAAARKYSYYMRQKDWFDHTDKEGLNFDVRVRAEKYPFAVVGENILVVRSNKDDLVMDETAVEFFFQGWKDSPKHYANMIHKAFREVGFGFSIGDTSNIEYPFAQYGSQEFGSQLKFDIAQVESEHTDGPVNVTQRSSGGPQGN